MTDDMVVLLKACLQLRLTYELRLATFMARQARRRLVVRVLPDCVVTSTLQTFAREHDVAIQRSER